MKREEIILSHVSGKDVLDIGSIGQTNHYRLWDIYASAAPKSLTGIDIVSPVSNDNAILKGSQNLNDPNIVMGNMETHQFNRTFDLVIAGDVIEHLNNQGLFLSNINRHLRISDRLIITTPNAKWATVFLRPNQTHTLWHDRHTLEQILKMNGFVIEKLYYYPGNKKKYRFPKNLLALRQALLVICKKASEGNQLD